MLSNNVQSIEWGEIPYFQHHCAMFRKCAGANDKQWELMGKNRIQRIN